MEEAKKLRLEFKRNFLLQNISDVKKEWYRHEDYREKLRIWFLTVWFGTLAIFLKQEAPGISLSALLLLETLVFFGLDIFYYRISRYRLGRISIMEYWIMSATDEEILNLEGPLAEVTRYTSREKLIDGWLLGIISPSVSGLFWVFIVLSVVVEFVLRNVQV